jgi:cyclic pyranopterin monophosphate synthase
MQKFSHTDSDGKARMVDVSAKPDQDRIAIAEGFITLEAGTLSLIRENNIKKGDVITVARIAGVQAAKQTANLIPLCHPLPLHHISIEELIEDDGIRIRAKVKTSGKTGVEMEALTATCTALLTIYDMCKAVDKNMIIEAIKLIEKKKQ